MNEFNNDLLAFLAKYTEVANCVTEVTIVAKVDEPPQITITQSLFKQSTLQQSPPVREPLSQRKKDELVTEWMHLDGSNPYTLIASIERAHGIGGDATPHKTDAEKLKEAMDDMGDRLPTIVTGVVRSDDATS